MEKIIKQVTAFKQVPNGTRDVISFVASDGKEFIGSNAEKECSKHEEELKFNEEFSKIKVIRTSCYLWATTIPDDFYVATTERELELIKIWLDYGVKWADYKINDKDDRDSNFVDLKVGDAITSVRDDAGDYRPTFYFYTLEYIRNQFDLFLKETQTY